MLNTTLSYIQSLVHSDASDAPPSATQYRTLLDAESSDGVIALVELLHSDVCRIATLYETFPPTRRVLSQLVRWFDDTGDERIKLALTLAREADHNRADPVMEENGIVFHLGSADISLSEMQEAVRCISKMRMKKSLSSPSFDDDAYVSSKRDCTL